MVLMTRELDIAVPSVLVSALKVRTYFPRSTGDLEMRLGDLRINPIFRLHSVKERRISATLGSMPG